jgi:hypothetical protein
MGNLALWPAKISDGRISVTIIEEKTNGKFTPRKLTTGRSRPTADTQKPKIKYKQSIK